MAGGVGSRFWPASTEEKPKQFLDILGVGKSLIRMTFERCLNIVPVECILIVTNKRYKLLVAQQLPELPEENILCEPAMNNTAPCVAYTALRIKAMNPEATFAVLPSDHVILKEEIYVQNLIQAFDFASNHDALVTLGIQPTRADTGYGYINFEAKNIEGLNIHKVLSFKEKPDAQTAQKYIESKEYLWNAGMFVWSVQSILKAFETHVPNILKILNQNELVYNTPKEQAYIDEVYPYTERISIDYAILEKAKNVFTIPSDIGWSDLGTWDSLHAYLTTPEKGIVSIGEKILLSDCEDVIIVSNNQKNIVIKGLKNYIVVDEDQALLIYPKSDEQEIKLVVQKLNDN